MEDSQLARAKNLFAEASALPAAARATWLTAQCGDDAPLLAYLLELLEYSGELGDVLDTSLPEATGLTAAPICPLEPGTILNERYRITRQFSAGGFATVYLAKDERLAARDVIVKVLDRAPSTLATENLANEVRALAAISHPGVVGIFDCGELSPSGIQFLVTQFVPGSTLRAVLKQARLSPATSLEIIRGIAAALSAAHRSNVLHLDLKPENIVVSLEDPSAPKVTIIDFGIASFLATNNDASPSFAGSDAYIAPEQRSGYPTLQSDIFSLAVVACEILTGVPATTPAAAREALDRAGATQSLINAIERALAPAPERRFLSVADFAHFAIENPPPVRWRWATAGVAILLVTLGFSWITRSRNTAPPSLGQVVPATSELGFETAPALSPDGKILFYSLGSSSIARDIYATNLADGDVTRLTSHPADDRETVCSHDGSQIAFIRTYKDSDQGIIVMPAAGGPETELVRTPSLFALEWSADGRSLLVASAPHPTARNTLKIFDIATRTWRPFLTPPNDNESDTEMALSPDARTVVFIRRFNSSANDLFTVTVDSRLTPVAPARRLTYTQTRKASPHWTPDGRHIIFGSGTLSALSMWRVSAEGGEPVKFSDSPARLESLAVARNVWKLAYSVDLTDANIWRLTLASPEGPVTSHAQIASSSFEDEEVKLSPDARNIAFVSQRSGTEQVWTAAIDGSTPRRVTAFDTVDSVVVNWMPGASDLLIALNASPQGRRGIFWNLSTGAQTVFWPHVFPVGISRDGARILGRSNQTGRDEIWSYDLATHATKQLTFNGARFAEESLDGKSLYFSRVDRREGLLVTTPGTSQETKVVPALAHASSFAVRAAGIFYIKPGPPAVVCLRRASDGREIELYTLDKRPFWGFDVSGDGKTIVFTQLDGNNNDIMIANNFR